MRAEPASSGQSRRSGPAVDRPRVSVLLPCRDVAPYLPRCIDSLESQTFGGFEVVAVDDHSTDDTSAILRDWSLRDARVRLLHMSSDGEHGRGGLVSALNLAARLARAPLLARMDGDDVVHPRRLEAQVDLLDRRRDLAACGARVQLFPARAVGTGYARYARWLNGITSPEDVRRDLLVECPIAHPVLMIRASVLHGLGGYRDAGWPEDYDLILRLHVAGMRAANVPRALLRWRIRSGRLSLSSERYAPAAFRRCKAHYLRLHFLPPDRPLVVWGAGKVGKPLARELIRLGSAVEAFVDLDPRKIGQEIHGARVLDPDAFRSLRRARDPYVLAAVGSPGARAEIRSALEESGCSEIDDFRVCA